MPHRTLALLREHGIRLSKRAGQHQVIDPVVLGLVVDYAELSSDDTVLEIGAGTGNLTCVLAERAGKIIAVERDRRFMEILREQVESFPNVELICGDVLHIEFPKFDKVVANLPYGISSEITFRLLERDFVLAVLMYQWEFAHRLVAEPGSEEYSRLTVNVRYRADVELLDEIPPTAFIPKPKVTSSIVRLRPREPPFEVVDERLFFDLVRALFQHRRQRVRNALYRSFGGVFPGPEISKVEKRAIIDKKLPKELAEARVMDLPPEKFGVIANKLRNSDARSAIS